jgi:hypothetical protein
VEARPAFAALLAVAPPPSDGALTFEPAHAAGGGVGAGCAQLGAPANVSVTFSFFAAASAAPPTPLLAALAHLVASLPLSTASLHAAWAFYGGVASAPPPAPAPEEGGHCGGSDALTALAWRDANDTAETAATDGAAWPAWRLSAAALDAPLLFGGGGGGGGDGDGVVCGGGASSVEDLLTVFAMSSDAASFFAASWPPVDARPPKFAFRVLPGRPGVASSFSLGGSAALRDSARWAGAPLAPAAETPLLALPRFFAPFSAGGNVTLLAYAVDPLGGVGVAVGAPACVAPPPLPPSAPPSALLCSDAAAPPVGGDAPSAALLRIFSVATAYGAAEAAAGAAAAQPVNGDGGGCRAALLSELAGAVGALGLSGGVDGGGGGAEGPAATVRANALAALSGSSANVTVSAAVRAALAVDGRPALDDGTLTAALITASTLLGNGSGVNAATATSAVHALSATLLFAMPTSALAERVLGGGGATAAAAAPPPPDAEAAALAALHTFAAMVAAAPPPAPAPLPPQLPPPFFEFPSASPPPSASASPMPPYFSASASPPPTRSRSAAPRASPQLEADALPPVSAAALGDLAALFAGAVLRAAAPGDPPRSFSLPAATVVGVSSLRLDVARLWRGGADAFLGGGGGVALTVPRGAFDALPPGVDAVDVALVQFGGGALVRSVAGVEALSLVVEPGSVAAAAAAAAGGGGLGRRALRNSPPPLALGVLSSFLSAASLGLSRAAPGVAPVVQSVAGGADAAQALVLLRAAGSALPLAGGGGVALAATLPVAPAASPAPVAAEGFSFTCPADPGDADGEAAARVRARYSPPLGGTAYDVYLPPPALVALPYHVAMLPWDAEFSPPPPPYGPFSAATFNGSEWAPAYGLLSAPHANASLRGVGLLGVDGLAAAGAALPWTYEWRREPAAVLTLPCARGARTFTCGPGAGGVDVSYVCPQATSRVVCLQWNASGRRWSARGCAQVGGGASGGAVACACNGGGGGGGGGGALLAAHRVTVLSESMDFFARVHVGRYAPPPFFDAEGARAFVGCLLLAALGLAALGAAADELGARVYHTALLREREVVCWAAMGEAGAGGRRWAMDQVLDGGRARGWVAAWAAGAHALQLPPLPAPLRAVAAAATAVEQTWVLLTSEGGLVRAFVDALCCRPERDAQTGAGAAAAAAAEPRLALRRRPGAWTAAVADSAASGGRARPVVGRGPHRLPLEATPRGAARAKAMDLALSPSVAGALVQLPLAAFVGGAVPAPLQVVENPLRGGGGHATARVENPLRGGGARALPTLRAAAAPPRRSSERAAATGARGGGGADADLVAAPSLPSAAAAILLDWAFGRTAVLPVALGTRHAEMFAAVGPNVYASLSRALATELGGGAGGRAPHPLPLLRGLPPPVQAALLTREAVTAAAPFTFTPRRYIPAAAPSDPLARALGTLWGAGGGGALGTLRGAGGGGAPRGGGASAPLPSAAASLHALLQAFSVDKSGTIARLWRLAPLLCALCAARCAARHPALSPLREYDPAFPRALRVLLFFTVAFFNTAAGCFVVTFLGARRNVAGGFEPTPPLHEPPLREVALGALALAGVAAVARGALVAACRRCAGDAAFAARYPALRAELRARAAAAEHLSALSLPALRRETTEALLQGEGASREAALRSAMDYGGDGGGGEGLSTVRGAAGLYGSASRGAARGWRAAAGGGAGASLHPSHNAGEGGGGGADDATLADAGWLPPPPSCAALAACVRRSPAHRRVFAAAVLAEDVLLEEESRRAVERYGMMWREAKFSVSARDEAALKPVLAAAAARCGGGGALEHVLVGGRGGAAAAAKAAVAARVGPSAALPLPLPPPARITRGGGGGGGGVCASIALRLPPATAAAVLVLVAAMCACAAYIVHFGERFPHYALVSALRLACLGGALELLALQPLLLGAKLVAVLAVWPAWEPYIAWLPGCGRCARGGMLLRAGAGRAALLGRLQGLDLVRAAGAASGMHPDTALLALGSVTRLSLALDGTRRVLLATSRAWPHTVVEGAGAKATAETTPGGNFNFNLNSAQPDMPVGLSPLAAPPPERAQLTARRYFLAVLRIAEAARCAELESRERFLRAAVAEARELRLPQKGAVSTARALPLI